MRRREFIAGLTAAATAQSGAFGQQSKQARRVGVLVGLAANIDMPVARAFLKPFREAMGKAGWVEDGNVHIDYRFGGALSDLANTRASAAELVALAPEVIYAQGLPATLALRQQTATIPIVFTQVIDPVGFKLADSLGHPGGNVTGFVVWDFEIGGKWMQLLRELDPKLAKVGILFNPDTAPYAPGLVAAARDAASGVEVIELQAHNDGETEAQIEALGRERNTGLLVIPEPFTNGHRDHIVAQCARFRVPALNSVLGAVDDGALMSYTFVWDELVSAPVDYIDRILKGASPRDLPIQAPRRYEMVVNLKTAKALGVDVPPVLLARADRVIE
ncbi:ABC transporter substrate-binding protein [Bradyrhizobium commune]|uniref:ABC transporter substrate-binding protein n=1 Tax=Bradyrhizobium commune TaxID=83627 RepID=A0A7S9D0N3_9BRAD|nr:ABC transporter substrate-binding protein [Bradyrhizobium commune]QPF88938.1 ABC transporter substrate-binding protein [Bradyrhizobium commune]